jgi:hypothetical protein
MGSKSEFTCDKCGYQAEVSGGRDCGMIAVVQTMICETCCQLVDVLTGRFGKEGPTGDVDYDKDLGACPGCHGKQLSAWSKSRPCPKCEGRMIQGQMKCLWD